MDSLKEENPRIQENIVFQELDGQVVLLDKTRKRVFKLNPTASLIFYFCDGHHPKRAILMELAKVFKAVGPDVLAGDLRSTLDTFKKEGIIS